MRVDAEKRYLVFAPPAILTLHLKRFVQVCTGSVQCKSCTVLGPHRKTRHDAEVQRTCFL